MFKTLFVAACCLLFSLSQPLHAPAQEAGSEPGFIIEEEIARDAETGTAATSQPRFITADVLTPADVEPALNFYIRSDINRKFSGLIANLKLEKIYGILQEDKTASVYFDYSYSSLRNMENVLYEKGRMTFLKFNSGRWFNAELSIYLMEAYPLSLPPDQQEKKE